MAAYIDGMAPERIAAVDVETTGLDPVRDRVVEIAVVVAERTRIILRRSWLVHPDIPIPRCVTRVHGIDDDDVRRAPRFAAIAAEVLAAIGTATPLAYNARFDRAFLGAELVRAGYPWSVARFWIDPLSHARAAQPDAPGHRMVDVAARLGIWPRRIHRALDDAETALAIYHRLEAG